MRESKTLDQQRCVLQQNQIPISVKYGFPHVYQQAGDRIIRLINHSVIQKSDLTTSQNPFQKLSDNPTNLGNNLLNTFENQRHKQTPSTFNAGT